MNLFRASALTGLAALTLTACQPDGCTIDNVTYTQPQCDAIEASMVADAEPGTSNVQTGVTYIEGFDTAADVVSLAELGPLYTNALGVNVTVTAWNELIDPTKLVGFNTGGGEGDWLVENSVITVYEVIAIDGDGDGVAEKAYSVVNLPVNETDPVMGNLINAGNDSCWDLSDEYYDTYNCWGDLDRICGAPFTAYVSNTASTGLGTCQLSVWSRVDGLSPGPDNGI